MIRRSLNEEFAFIIERSTFCTKLDLSQISIERDIKHEVPTLFMELNRLTSLSNNKKSTQSKALVSISRNYSNLIESLNAYENRNFDSVIPLYDIENWILSLSENVNISCKTLYEILEKYSNIATKFYKNDPIGYSRLILASLKLVCALDQIAAKEFPMLLEHKIGFDSKSLECLLLPLQSQMKCAYKLKEYIDKRNDTSIDPSLVDFSSTSISSYFGAKHAENHLGMLFLKQQILLKIELKEIEKRAEVLLKRKEYENKMEISNNMKCEYFTNWRGYTYHDRYCSKCSLSLEARRMEVDVYERCLPEDETLRNLVMFELRIPESISFLRDAIYILKANILNSTKKDQEELKGLWIEYPEISSYALGIQNKITLGSTTKLFASSHYKSLHPSRTLEEFVVKNGYNLRLSCKVSDKTAIEYVESSSCPNLLSPSANKSPKSTFKNFCVFKATSPYEALQFSLESCKHNENEVIAIQNKCHPELSLHEFINYGFFRAGNRLQLKNLLAALITRKNLSFSHQAVLSLITQSLYELESLEEPVIFSNDNIYPIAHADFENEYFCRQLTEALNEFVELSSKKWNDNLVLLSVIRNATRAITMAPNLKVVKRMAKIMRKCRFIALQWQKDVENVIENLDYTNKIEFDRLNLKVLEISCFGVLTFNSSESDKINILMNSSEDIFNWLNLVSGINNYNSLYGNENFKSSHLLVNILREVQITISLVESQYCDVMNTQSARPLNEYVKSIWPAEGQIMEWKQKDAPLQEWYEAKFISNSSSDFNTLQLGINGEFLVDYQPVGRLPTTIIKNKLYEEYFLDINFKVYPSTSFGSYITSIGEKNDIIYEFKLHEKDLIINEKVKSKNESLQLIPRTNFKKLFPVHLVNDYSHWLNERQSIIVFRSKCHTENFQNIDYVFNLKSKILHETKSEDVFFDIKSKTFLEIENKITNKIEISQHVHLVYRKNWGICISLPRMSLNFEIDSKNGNVMSREFRGFMVENIQNLKTLVGLQKGLVLTEVKELNNCLINKKLILPHGKIEVSSSDTIQFKQIDINCEKLNNPAFFSYDIDSRLKILKPGESITSRLYLACLHAYTSHILPDPFLEQTGTEMAFKMLQSGYCWSMEPYSVEALNILECISRLSPQRSFYPIHLKSMQTCDWLENIPSFIAHEGFQLVVNRLKDDSKRLETSRDSQIRIDEYFLSIRAYNRNSSFYNLSASLNRYFEIQIIQSPSSLRIFPSFKEFSKDDQNSTAAESKQIFSFDLELSKKVREIKENTFRSRINLIQYITGPTLKGKSKNQLDSFAISDWIVMSKDFKDYLIDLYDFSRLSSLNVERQIKLNMILSLFSYASNISIGMLMFFKIVSTNPNQFMKIIPPKYEAYEDLDEFEYQKDIIIEIVERSFVDFETYKVKNPDSDPDSDFPEQKSQLKQLLVAEKYKETKQNEIDLIEKFYSKYKLFLNIYEHPIIEDNFFDSDFRDEIEKVFEKWRKNRELREFLELVESTYNTINPKPTLNRMRKFCKIKRFPAFKINKKIVFNLAFNRGIFGQNFNFNQQMFLSQSFKQNINKILIDSKDEAKNVPAFPLNIGRNLNEIEKKYLNDLKESWDIFHCSDKQNNKSIMSSIQNHNFKANLENLSASFQQKINGALINIFSKLSPKTNQDKLLQSVDLWPRTTPTQLISYLVSKPDRRIFIQNEHKALIKELLVLWVNHQRFIRCLRFFEEKNENSLIKELINIPHENWSPSKHYNWLLLELEGDFAIRKLQVKVARKMIKPTNNKNTIMQLNMGEGNFNLLIKIFLIINFYFF